MSVIHVPIYYGHGYWVTTAIFTLFKFVDNITLPAKGEVEGSKNFYTVIIELVPIKKCTSYQKGLPPILVFLVPFFVKHEFLVLFPSLSFCLMASVASAWPVLLALGCKMPISWWWFSPWDRLSSRTNLWLFPIKPVKCYIQDGMQIVVVCIYCKCCILGSIRQRIRIETQGRGEVCLPVIFSSTVKSIRTKADVY